MKPSRLAILVGGGPAPGINAVIGSATIEAINNGMHVTGIYDGFRWLCSNQFSPQQHTTVLNIRDVARIHFTGGSILRTARTSLLDDERLKTSRVVYPDAAKVQRVLDNLRQLQIDSLITIGGDDTALSARFIAEACGGAIRIVHVPKTIDNDLPLPHDVSTFGFSTARLIGVQIVKNLMEDSKTTGRWYLVTAMGRNAGWLALGITKSAGATLSLIPEEFSENTTLARIADVLEGAIFKRRAMGRPDGVAVIAEGLAYRLGDRAELERLLGKEVPVDAAGHLRLAEVPLGEMLKNELVRRFKERGEDFTMVTHMLGYELRSADPTPADIAYCRDLGYGSIRLLLDSERALPSGVMVTLVNGNLVPMDFHEMIDPQTNRTRIRLVNVKSLSYRVARAYMIRLERSDLDNPQMLAELADAAKMSPERFRERYLMAATRLANGDHPSR
ncbi:MAG: 6-phosphofructokinase [Phycisphaerae bacterium]|nr:6-phosphofructokinase [Phycisphaerae bacterium]